MIKMFRRSRDINYQPYIISNDYTYSPQSGMYIPTNNPQDERFGGLLLPALGGFLVGTLVPTPWGPRPMYQPQPYMNTYSGYGYQTMMPYPTTPINTTNPQ
jgi:hypothetical protein